jgi:hypothetical protein
MSNQMLAKVGVFALIVLNLGAYYVFWPGNGWRSGNTGQVPAAPSMEKGDNPGKPVQVASTAGAAQPTQQGKSVAALPPVMPPVEPLPPPLDAKPAPSASDKEPFVIVLPPIPDPNNPAPATNKSDAGSANVVAAKAEDPTIEQLKRLKNSFAKENAATNPPELQPVVKPDSLNLKPVPQDNAIGKPVQPENSPWTLHMEIAGGQKVLVARLNKRTEFRILCDHVEMKTTEGAVVAVGHVTVFGSGLKGTCNRLILRLSGDSFVLDGKAEVSIQQGGNVELNGQTAELKGEQLSLRLQQQQPAPMTPVSSNPPPPTNPPAVTNPLPNPFTPAPPFAIDKK